MASPKRKTSHKGPVADVRSGMDDKAPKTKHPVSQEKFRRFLVKLMGVGALEQAEIEERTAYTDVSANATEPDTPSPSSARRNAESGWFDFGSRKTVIAFSIFAVLALVTAVVMWPVVGVGDGAGARDGISFQLAVQASEVRIDLKTHFL